ncbi:MAG: sigma-54 dependent transcriptional regulator, partial [Bacteroidales bacterium]|nr:sigma-54 dependent transcriptional regulator [Bacteroidales bacterium]
KLSRRRHESMVTVDIGSLTESLFEIELFGHVKGAFTDAKVDRAGKFEVASGGTLLLDEIGNIPLHLQSKLLTAIQSRTITRVGSNKIIPIDIRMICATNKDLSKMVTENLFREDLLYRINTIHITIPPLRDRKEDIIPLALIFLSKYSKKYGKNIENIDTKASTMLESYHWSGNIRELQHSIEKAVMLAESGELTDRDLFLVQKDFKVEANDAAVFTLEDIEKEAIKAALTKHNWNLSAVAQQLDITRQTLYNKLKKYNL